MPSNTEVMSPDNSIRELIEAGTLSGHVVVIYTVPMTGTVYLPSRRAVDAAPVTGMNVGRISYTFQNADEVIEVQILSVNWKTGEASVSIAMPTRIRTQFDTFLNGKTMAQILSDAGKTALVVRHDSDWTE